MIQILKNVLKIEQVFATIGSEDKREYLEKKLNVTKAINYKLKDEENFQEIIQKMTDNKGVDVIFDCVGASYWQKNIASLSMDGEWILYGLMGGSTVNGDILNSILRKRIHLKGSTLRARSIEVKMLSFVKFFLI